MKPGSAPPVVGVAEVAELCDVSRQAVSNWRSRGLLPKPLAVLRSGPVWNLDDILYFMEALAGYREAAAQVRAASVELGERKKQKASRHAALKEEHP